MGLRISLGVVLLLLWLTATAWAVQQTSARILDIYAEPPSYVITSGTLSATEHELAEGWFALGQATAILVKPDSPSWMRLRELRGKRVELVMREIE